MNNFLYPFFSDLTEEERVHENFQQDTATTHVACASLEAVHEVFSNCIISTGLWPTSSPNLTNYNFYLWRSLKHKVYKTYPYTLEEPRNNIWHEFLQFLGKNSRELTPPCSAGTLIAYAQEGNIYSICFTNGDFFLNFLKVILAETAYC
jgi:hypothetical protein